MLHARNMGRAEDAQGALPQAAGVVIGDLSALDGMRQVAEQADAAGPFDAVIHTTVVVTDHGHLDEGGHGGREPEVTTAWAAAAGPGIVPGGPPLITRQDQVAPLVLRAAGRAAARTA